jgi:hypothetical protein
VLASSPQIEDRSEFMGRAYYLLQTTMIVGSANMVLEGIQRSRHRDLRRQSEGHHEPQPRRDRRDRAPQGREGEKAIVNLPIEPPSSQVASRLGPADSKGTTSPATPRPPPNPSAGAPSNSQDSRLRGPTTERPDDPRPAGIVDPSDHSGQTTTSQDTLAADSQGIIPPTNPPRTPMPDPQPAPQATRRTAVSEK